MTKPTEPWISEEQPEIFIFALFEFSIKMKLAPSIITCCAIWLVLIILVNIINVINKLCLVIIMSFFFLFLIIIISFFLPFLVIVMYFFHDHRLFLFSTISSYVWHCKSCQFFCFSLPRKKKTLWRGGAGGYKEKAEPSPNDWCLTVNVSGFNCIIPPHAN